MDSNQIKDASENFQNAVNKKIKKNLVDNGPSCSTPAKEDNDSSNDSTSLQIIVPYNSKNSMAMDIDKEIEEDIEMALETKQRKTNLTVKNVKSILRYVIENENVLAMINNSMKESGMEVEPTITRSKARQLRNNNQIMWPLSPIAVTSEAVEEAGEKEHLVLISGELPDEEDDDEYRPTLDDLQEPSDDESGILSTTGTSVDQFTAGRYLESFDPTLLLDDNLQVPAANVLDPTLENFEEMFKKPTKPENIGQRTRSKFSLSSTPLETIEQAFEPPDITTDMYELKCHDQEWENFLKEFMQPLPNDDVADVDEEDDPEYNAMAEEEQIDKEELRRDRAVKVPRAEVRKLMEELAGCCEGDEPSSEEEDHVPAPATQPLIEPENVPRSESPVCDEPEEVIGMTASQHEILLQQLRQHVQLITQHFLQVFGHPVHMRHAQFLKTMMAELVELSKVGDKTVNVFNLTKAYALMEYWEVSFDKNRALIEQHIAEEAELAVAQRKKKKIYRPTFHLLLMRTMSNSDVFVYPGMLPQQPFRSDHTASPDFLNSEDHLIALGLDQFVPYVQENPPTFWGRKRGDLMNAADMIHDLVLPARQTIKIYTRIKNMKGAVGNPIWVCNHVIQYWHKHGHVLPVCHLRIPFDLSHVPSPKDQPGHLLPKCWKEFIHHTQSCTGNKKCLQCETQRNERREV